MINPLVVGRDRQLRTELLLALSHAGFEPDAELSDGLELSDPDECRRVVAAARADVVIDCSGAYESSCEEPARIAEELSTGAANIALAAAGVDALSVFVSSVAVFCETEEGPRIESDPPTPATPLARSAVAAERAIARLNARHAIVRTSGLYAQPSRGLLRDILARAETVEELFVEPVAISAPTYAPHLAEVLIELLHRPCYGIIHRCAAGECDAFALVQAVVALAGISCRVQPAAGPTAATFTPSLTRARLASRRDELRFLPPWQIGLRACMSAAVDDPSREPQCPPCPG